MWRLRCPDYDKATGEDIDRLVSLGVLAPAEKDVMAKLVEDYHSQSGNITSAQQNTLAPATRGRLHKGYKVDKLMYEGGDMADVSAELYENVGACPYCGMSSPETLDHFMHKDVWRSLSLCRLNLVPCCWRCNGAKGRKDSLRFIHPYYTELPDGVFLRARCEIKGTGYLFRFDFDPTVVTDAALIARLRSQWNELKLDSRLRPAVTGFICSSVVKSANDADALRVTLPIILADTEEKWGRNHWRAAVLRCCVDEVNGARRDRFLAVVTDPANRQRDMLI